MDSNGIIVGILQASSTTSKEEALRKIESIPRLRKRASLIVTPEYMMADPTGLTRDEIARVAEGLDGVYVGTVRRVARRTRTCIIANLFEKNGKKIYNTTILVDDTGDIVGVRRKHFLFDAYGYRESSIFDRGEPPNGIFNACGLRMGIAVCFELRFPEIFRLYMIQGADAFIVPAAWYKGDGKEETLRTLAQARSHENAAYTIIAALYGQRFTGRSMIVDPMGLVVVDLGFDERYRETDIDLDLVKEARQRLPVKDILESSEWARGLYRHSSTGTNS